MNQKPSYASPSPSPSSFSSYEFDFGLGSNRNSSKPLRDTKPATGPAYGGTHRPQPPPASTNKPSWTHQPAPGAAAGGSMTGDIFGRSWGVNSSPSPDLGIPKSNPKLFGDLIGSALNQGKSNSNVPLKAVPPRNSYSMGTLSDSLPKSTPNSTTTTNSAKTGWGSFDNPGNLSSTTTSSTKTGWGSPGSIGNFSSLGGQPLKSSAGATSSNPKRDPFGPLMDFSSKNSGKAPISSGIPPKSTSNPSFGAFQNANAPPSVNSSKPAADASFGAFQDASFGIPAYNPPKPADSSFGDFKSAKDPQSDSFDILFASASQSQFSETNDWDMGSEFGGGGDHGATTTELEGLPPPPAGVTASMATSKGMDNYKQGQYADAIKWLSWAVVLIEKFQNDAAATEVLTCRASCYKEVGEYKKAVADCSKVLAQDSENVSVLLQRALLYESTEKYRLGAEDLRTVLKIDPGNRLAKSTIHRLNKLAEF